MGIRRHEIGSPINADTLQEVANAASGVGIGEQVAAEAHPDPMHLLEALESSPFPEGELARLADLYGYRRLAELTGTSEPSLRRYGAGDRRTPDDVAGRIHFLALITAVLRGSFNEFGTRRWFERPRAVLGERKPSDLLEGSWSPEDEGPQAAVRLATTLLA
jgi:uncharacterized protein (DUF2384 family)